MRKDIKVGAVVKVTHSGYTYNTYTEKAIELHADVSKYLINCLRSQTRPNTERARSDRSSSWVYGQNPRDGDIGIVINKSASGDDRYSEKYILIERIGDGRQFILESSGLTVDPNREMFSDKDFEL